MAINRAPTRPTERPGVHDSTERKHPAFGMIGANRIHGVKEVLFGSPIKHGNVVKIEITEATETLSLNRSWYHGTDVLAEVWLSEAQWAAFVSTLNAGSGVPCTVRAHRAGGMEWPPDIEDMTFAERRARDISDQVRRNTEQLRECMAELERLVAQGKAGKRELEGLRRMFIQPVDNAPANYQFAADSLSEHAEHLVTAAKAEVSAMVLHLAMQYPQLADRAPEMPAIEHQPGGTDGKGG